MFDWRFLKFLFHLSFDFIRSSMFSYLKHLSLFRSFCTSHLMFFNSVRSKFSSTLRTRNSIIFFVDFNWWFISCSLLLDWRFQRTSLLLCYFFSFSKCISLWTVIVTSWFLLKAWCYHFNCSFLLYFFLCCYLWVSLFNNWRLVNFSLTSKCSS